jgi:hypothetical protein
MVARGCASCRGGFIRKLWRAVENPEIVAITVADTALNLHVNGEEHALEAGDALYVDATISARVPTQRRHRNRPDSAADITLRRHCCRQLPPRRPARVDV